MNLNTRAAHTAKRRERDIEKGVALLTRGRHKEAVQLFKALLERQPDDVLTLYNCGIAYYSMGQYALAKECYLAALTCLPDWVEAYHNLGQAYEGLDNLPEAIAVYERALQLKPDYFHSAYRLGLLYRLAGEDQKAMAAIQTAVMSKPDSAEALCTLGVLYRERNRFEEALVCLDQALRIDPHLAQACYNKGIVLQKSGEFEKGVGLYRKAAVSDPAFAPAKWLYHLSLPMMYDSQEEIDDHRRRFQRRLKDLIESTSLETDEQKAYALTGIRTTTNFYLQYQCRNDLILQSKYGRFVHQVMQGNYPHWSRDRQMPSWDPGEKIRIGYVSTFMYDHTVGTFLSGWLENHSRDEFDIHCYHVGRKVDHLTHYLRSLSHHFHYFSGNMEAAARQLDEDNLHLLVYSDIGMAPITLQLAALRLAPIQCKGWGHPVTTGLPTIDYYLSSDLMEPESAQDHYSETLVRLPNLALCYRPPQLPETPKSRRDLKLPDDRFLYLSTQSIFKYLPQHDDIYPRIAKAVPHACFVFLANESESATAKFRLRLKNAFAEFGLVADQYYLISKRLNFKDFLSLNMVSDVLLDSLEWSGGKTTLEALTCSLPVVTLPGRFMRGRHAYAMLKMMGLIETIAKDKASYCEIAVRLAQDSAFFSRINRLIAQNKTRLYEDRSFIKALEIFYHKAVLNTVNSATPSQTAYQSNY
jgi:predicted O-linked N-acetylglucosamine transferase (SPINDLY family)